MTLSEQVQLQNFGMFFVEAENIITNSQQGWHLVLFPGLKSVSILINYSTCKMVNEIQGFSRISKTGTNLVNGISYF